MNGSIEDELPATDFAFGQAFRKLFELSLLIGRTLLDDAVKSLGIGLNRLPELRKSELKFLDVHRV